MIGSRRTRFFLSLLLVGAVLGPDMSQAQSLQERREQEIRAQLAQLEAVQEARLAQTQEALARVREELAAQESLTQEQLASRLARIEEALAQAKLQAQEVGAQAQAQRQEALVLREMRAREALAQAQHQIQDVHAHQEQLLARELRARERDLSRVRARDQEVRYRVAEALARAEEGQERIRIRARSRVRLGVTLSGTQDADVDRQGALIQGVMEESPAGEAGLEKGDIVTHLDGHSLLEPLDADMEEDLDEDLSLPVQRLTALAQDLEDGQEVEIRYLRDGDTRTTTLEASEMDEPNVLVLRSDRGDRGHRGVVRIHPEDANVWTFSGPDEKVLSLRLSELEELKGMEDLDRVAIELKALESLDELAVTLEDLDVDPDVFTLRTVPKGKVGAYNLRTHARPRVLELSRGAFGFGLQVTTINPALGEYFSAESGALVLEVDEDSPFALEPGDVIQAVDGRTVESERELWRILGSYEDDESFTLSVVRKGQTIEVEGTRG